MGEYHAVQTSKVIFKSLAFIYLLTELHWAIKLGLGLGLYFSSLLFHVTDMLEKSFNATFPIQSSIDVIDRLMTMWSFLQ